MKRIITKKGLTQLKNGTILIQKYHQCSRDGSKFDINVKRKDGIYLLEQIGGTKEHKNGIKCSLEDVGYKISTNPRCLVYIADMWIQKLYWRHKNEFANMDY